MPATFGGAAPATQDPTWWETTLTWLPTASSTQGGAQLILKGVGLAIGVAVVAGAAWFLALYAVELLGEVWHALVNGPLVWVPLGVVAIVIALAVGTDVGPSILIGVLFPPALLVALILLDRSP